MIDDDYSADIVERIARYTGDSLKTELLRFARELDELAATIQSLADELRGLAE